MKSFQERRKHNEQRTTTKKSIVCIIMVTETIIPRGEKMTKEQAKLDKDVAFKEFDDNFKEDFYDEWWSLSDKGYQKEFYYWCSMYDDTKHIKK